MLYSNQYFPKETGVKTLPWIYFHGSLETEMGHDNVLSMDENVNKLYDRIANDEVDSGVIRSGAETKDKLILVDVFLWKDEYHMRGLVIDISVTDDVAYAQVSFNNRVTFL